MTRVRKDPKAEPERPSTLDEDDVPEVEIGDAIDLHNFRPRDIPLVIEDYLEAAADKGFVEVRLIHGKGVGFQRQRVREILQRHPKVLRFADAPPTRGGWGATLVLLASSDKSQGNRDLS